MTKYVTFAFGLFFCTTVLIVPSFAQILTKQRPEFKLPLLSNVQDQNFGRPDSIYVFPLVLEGGAFIGDDEWYKGLFYYQAIRLNQGDFLMHYFVTSDGEVIEGNSYGEVQRFGLENPEHVPVIIGYLGEKGSQEFTNEARNALGGLLVDVANRNQIDLSQVFIKEPTYVATVDQEIVTRAGDASALWARSLGSVISSIENKYNPGSETIELELLEVSLPEVAVDYGEDIIADITIKNNSSTAIYQGTDFEFVASKVSSGFSIFSINDLWLTPSTVSIMAEGEALLPGDTKTFQLRLKAPLYFGQQTETFQLINLLGDPYINSNFNISLNIKELEQDAVEITGAGLAFINVFAESNSSSAVVTKVSPGQRYLVVESANGYVKIDAGGGKFGWVNGVYTKAL